MSCNCLSCIKQGHCYHIDNPKIYNGNFLNLNFNKICIDCLNHDKISDEVIIKNIDKLSEIKKAKISRWPKCHSDPLFSKIKNKLDWEAVSKCFLSEEFIRKNIDFIYFFSLHETSLIEASFKFFEDFSDKLNWELISIIKADDIIFIKKFQDKIIWKIISHFVTDSNVVTTFIDKIFYNKLSNNLKKDFSKLIHLFAKEI